MGGEPLAFVPEADGAVDGGGEEGGFVLGLGGGFFG